MMLKSGENAALFFTPFSILYLNNNTCLIINHLYLINDQTGK